MENFANASRDLPHLQHQHEFSSIISGNKRQVSFSPFEVVGQTHAEAFSSRLHASANHQPVAGFEDVQRAGHGGEGHGAHEYRHVLVETVATNAKTKSSTV